MDNLKQLIREVPDFPKPGINFYDITTLLKHPDGLKGTVDALAAEYEGTKVDVVIGVEARGFIFASLCSSKTATGFTRQRHLLCNSYQSKRSNGPHTVSRFHGAVIFAGSRHSLGVSAELACAASVHCQGPGAHPAWL